ncbi:sigma-70 family RNA polymerase sigma factor [Streptomyces sp. NPDC048639]|uniref:sigma-70 family RNA polymerase sigma factor n=1 Tax=Streptomyces sp. NPDC048639 TaxID=3365581 RepID=UPI00371AD19A
MRHRVVEEARPKGKDAPAPAPDTAGRSPAPHADEAFIRALYAKHGAVLVRFATSLLDGDRHRAEDVVQEAVLRAWRHSDVLDPTAESVRPWMFRVVRNLVIDGHRSKQARPMEAGDAALVEVAMPDDMEQTLTAMLVLETMEKLAPHHREVLLHMHYLGRSVAQTAQELNVPPGTVKSRTYYAVRALREALDARGITA